MSKGNKEFNEDRAIFERLTYMNDMKKEREIGYKSMDIWL